MKIFVCVNFNYADNWGNVFGLIFFLSSEFLFFSMEREHVFMRCQQSQEKKN